MVRDHGQFVGFLPVAPFPGFITNCRDRPHIRLIQNALR
jgi:hypothetical protein